MNQIDFLPESFRQNRERRQRRPVEFALIGLTAAALIALWLYTSGPDRTLADQSEQLDHAIDKLQQQQAEQARLQEEHNRLQRRLHIARETHQPIRVTQALARLSELAPPPVRLIGFELVAERPAPEPAIDPNAKQPNPRVVTGNAAGGAPQPRDPNRMKIQITGLAPSDEEIVVFIQRLEQDPVFTAVALRNSRMTRTKTHHAREFQVDLEIDLDRRFLPELSGGGRDAP